MKIAIPVFQTKISPRFDIAQIFLLLLIENSSVTKREDLPVVDLSLASKRKQLMDLDIDTLICGGIDLESMQHLSSGGIRIYSWITGEIEDAITRFIDKGLEPGIILGARGKRKGQWRFCTRRDHFCHVQQGGFKPEREEVKIMPKGNGSSSSGKGAGAGKGAQCGRAGKGAGRGKGRGTGQCRNQSGGKGKNRLNGR